LAPSSLREHPPRPGCFLSAWCIAGSSQRAPFEALARLETQLESQQKIHDGNHKDSIVRTPFPRFSSNHDSVWRVTFEPGKKRSYAVAVGVLDRFSELDFDWNHGSVRPLNDKIDFAHWALSVSWVFEIPKKMDLQSVSSYRGLRERLDKWADMIRR
jgi:hypothetical protein